MHVITKPMLAVDYDPAQLVLPVIASPKIDGLRCLKINGKALTRSLKPIPNHYIRSLVESLPDGLDGELVSGHNFRDSTSSVRSEYGEPRFTYYLFDYVKEGLDQPFQQRIAALRALALPEWCVVLPQRKISSIVELQAMEAECLTEGYEGLMLRKPDGPYKCNRSTLKEGYLLKVKRFLDGEAVILDFYEQEENTNEAFTNELGHTARSSHQEGKVGKNTLGGVVVRDVEKGVVFKIGTGIGWTIDFRKDVWRNQDYYRHRIIKYRHLPHGNYDVPRHATMQGFREEWDL